jgi:cellulose synthase/poly-beta-1,6-N-acetylglucosamine synthase-like glycosyltransferase
MVAELTAPANWPAWAEDARPVVDLTIIVPAYNEAEHVADTVRSLLAQTVRPARVVVVDDCSTDETAMVAALAGAEVMRPPANTGTKAGAQNFALLQVETEFTMAIDGDTVLAPDAIEKILPAIADQDVAAACGYVVPRHIRCVWERGRYVEYLYTFTFLKQVQDYYGKPLISSGCFSLYRTADLKAAGGWQTRTMAEDMDLTWTFYQRNKKVRFVPEAVCYPVEPHNFEFMSKQLRRWSAGFIQNVKLHAGGILRFPYLRSVVGVACWDALIGALFLFIALPLLAALVSPLFLLGYVIDAPVVVVPLILAGIRRRELRRVLASTPAFFVLRLTNAAFIIHAAWRELVLRRPLNVYEKGH